MRLKDLSDEELFEISLKRDEETGNYTARALKAQIILWDRHQESVYGEREFVIPDNGVRDRDLNDIYYNGYED